MVLGLALTDSEHALYVAENVDPDDFTVLANRLVLDAIKGILDQGRIPDRVLVAQYLRMRGNLDRIGGLSYLASLDEGIPPGASIGSYVRELKSLRARREVYHHCFLAAQRVCFGDPIDDVRSDLISKLESLRNGYHPGHALKRFVDVFGDWPDPIEAIVRMNEDAGMGTGFAELDHAIGGGLRRGEVVVLGARTSIGKTAFACQVAIHAARKGYGVHYHSLEMPAARIMERCLCHLSGVELWKIRKGHLSPDERDSLKRAVDILSGCPIRVADSGAVTVQQIHDAVVEHSPALVVVDYLQLVTPPGHADTRAQEVAEISRALKQMAMKRNVAVLALSQLNRESDKRGGEPSLSDLRESGAIEQDADTVLLLWRNGIPDARERSYEVKLTIAKSRYGPTGKMKLLFCPGLLTFRVMEADGS